MHSQEDCEDTSDAVYNFTSNPFVNFILYVITKKSSDGNINYRFLSACSALTG